MTILGRASHVVTSLEESTVRPNQPRHPATYAGGTDLSQGGHVDALALLPHLDLLDRHHLASLWEVRGRCGEMVVRGCTPTPVLAARGGTMHLPRPSQSHRARTSLCMAMRTLPKVPTPSTTPLV